LTPLVLSIWSRVVLGFLCLGLLWSPVDAPAGQSRHYQYLSPVPGAQYVSPWNNIIIRQGEPIDESTINAARLSVTGMVSGSHTGHLFLADDGRTLLFTPDNPFEGGEIVEVKLKPGVRNRMGRILGPLKYQFSVSSYGPGLGRQRSLEEAYPDMAGRLALPSLEARETSADTCDCLPEHYPVIEIMTSNDPGPGYLFVTPFSFTERIAHLAIIDSYGMPIYYRNYPGGIGMDFKRQPTGDLSAFVRGRDGFVVYDSSYAEVDHYQAGNGYSIDFHGLQLLPNGHALVQIYDQQAVRMDQVVPGGRADAVVEGFIFQELDAARNVVFQWRSWDHMEITDLTAPHIALTDSAIDYVHGNSVELDHDGGFIISSRHINEVTKISRETGEIVWRLGLNAKNNEFKFLNDDRGFSHQHDARRLPNGNITVYDNGVLLNPEYSRAIEYSVDEESRVAALVWEYRSTPDIYAGFLGNFQKRVDGSATIGWGGTIENPNITDLHPDGSIALQLGLGPGYISYRGFRFPWRTNRFVTGTETLEFGSVAPGADASLPLSIRNNTLAPLTIHCFVTTDPAFSVPDVDSLVIEAGASETVQVQFAPDREGDFSGQLYLRQVSADELVAQTVLLKGVGASSRAMDDVAPSLRFLGGHQNPTTGPTTIRFELPGSGRVILEVFDVRGRRMETLVDELRQPGEHSLKWDARGRSSGIYFYRLQQGDAVKTEKVILLSGS
jgi:hypothetical protein